MSRRRPRAEVKRANEVGGRSPANLPAANTPSPEGSVVPVSRVSALPRRLIPLLLIGAGLAAYHNSFGGAFLLDDLYWIVPNPRIRQFWPPWHAMAHNSRPLVQLSLAVNYALGGLNVWGYHAFNLVIHLLGGLVLFGIVRRMLESERLRGRYDRSAPWLAMAVALIWLVHPLQTESVTYIIQRAESLMGLFYLLTLYCGIRGAQSPHPGAWYTAAIIACALGMGSKEVMVSAPLVMLLYDRMFIAASFKDIFRQRGGLYVGLATTWLLLGTLLAAAGSQEKQTVMVAGLTPWRYGLTQFGVIVHYLWLSVWPRPLILDYTWPLADSMLSVLPSAAVVLGLLAGTLLALFRHAWVGFWGAWLFLILAPTSSVLPLADVVFEHRMYLPLAAVAVLVIIGGHEALGVVLRRLRAPDDLRRWAEIGLIGATAAILGYATVHRNEDYRSQFAMLSDILAKRPDNPRAHNNLGMALLAQGRITEAIPHWEAALRLKPDYVTAHLNLGDALLRQGRVEEAIPHLEAALRLEPNLPGAASDLGSAQAKLASALAGQGRRKEAIAQYSAALRQKPDYAEAHNNVALLLAEEGEMQRAGAHFSQALRLRPDYASAHNNLGVLLYRQGRVNEAITHFAEAVRLEPDSTNALNNLRAAQASLGHAKDRP